MTRDAISDLIACGEGPTVEFKRSLTKDGGRELCAFANADGGTILIGVSDAGEIVGVANHNRVKSRVQSTARSADPPIELEVESVGRVLRVVVPPQKRKPYSFGGRFFMRIGANSQQMSNAAVEDLFYAVGAFISTGSPARIFPSRTISMKRPGRGSATAPRFRKPWIGWWLSETSVYWTGRTA